MQHYSKTEAGSVRGMFANIAERYDLLNRLMSFGVDRRWRRLAIEQLMLSKGALVADIGCGTGDLAFETLKQDASTRLIASDFTWEMIVVAKRREGAEKIIWLVADAQALPFADASFDACVSGFLLRNVPNLPQALAEQYRLLKKEGRIATLDTSPSQQKLLKPVLHFYLKWVIPLLGNIIAGDKAAYTYLPESTQHFLEASILEKRLAEAGFSATGFRRLMLGSIAVHWAQKMKK